MKTARHERRAVFVLHRVSDYVWSGFQIVEVELILVILIILFIVVVR